MVEGDIVPPTDITYSLGSTGARWKDLYVGTGTVHIGDAKLSAEGSDIVIHGNIVPAQNEAFSIGSTTQRLASVHIGPGTVFIGPTGTLGNDSNGIIYAQYGLAAPSLVLGATIPGATGTVGGGVRMTLTGPTGPIQYQVLDTSGNPIGDIYSLTTADSTGPTGPTGAAGLNGVSNGLVLFMDAENGTSPVTGTLSETVDTSTQTSIGSGNHTNTNDVLLATFITAAGSTKSTVIASGVWETHVYFASSTTAGVTYYASAYYVDSDGTSNATLIAAGTAASATAVTQGVQAEHIYNLFVPTTVLPDLTKRIEIRIYGNFTGNNRHTAILLRDSTVSHVITTILSNPGTGPTGPTGPASSGYICAAKLNSTQTVSQNTDTIVQFVDDLDPNNWWDAGNYRFQPTINGYYMMHASVWWSAGASGATNQTNLQFRKNGSGAAIVQHQIVPDNGNSLSISKLFQLNGSTDYIDVTVYTGNTGGQDLQASGGTWFYAALQ